MKNRDKEQGKQWKNELYNGLLELGFVFVVLVVAFGIVALLPRELAQALPVELLLVAACFLTALVGGGLYLFLRWRKKKKAEPGKEDAHENL